MTRARLDGLIFLSLGGALFLFLGLLQEYSYPILTADFDPIYYSARTLLEHRDPYNPAEVLSVFRAEGGDRPAYSDWDRKVVSVFLYPPSVLIFGLPLALLSWDKAQALWIVLMAANNLLGAYLLWRVGARHAPVLSGVLIGYWLANNESSFSTGNAAGLAVGLCIIAVCCFLEERCIAAGILCLACSLALKPQDAGLVWLGLLLAGGVYRKRAWQTLAATALLSLPALLWTMLVSPHWLQEFLASYRNFSLPGSINDPGPSSPAAYGVAVITSLPRILSFFCNEPGVYNPLSHLLCAPLLAVWAALTLRRGPAYRSVWLALAAAVALAMLCFYHRQYDAKLLLLAVPPAAMLWAEGGRLGKMALAVTSAAVFFNGDLPWNLYQSLLRQTHLAATGFASRVALAGMFFPVPLALLATGLFYLYAGVRTGNGGSD
jgi:hypothetical protein